VLIEQVLEPAVNDVESAARQPVAPTFPGTSRTGRNEPLVLAHGRPGVRGWGTYFVPVAWSIRTFQCRPDEAHRLNLVVIEINRLEVVSESVADDQFLGLEFVIAHNNDVVAREHAHVAIVVEQQEVNYVILDEGDRLIEDVIHGDADV
jgi:hypothetical protein